MKKSPVLNKGDIAELGIGSPSTIDRMEAAGTFPRRIRLSPGSRRVFWRAHEVEQWLRDRGLQVPDDRDDRTADAVPASRPAKPRPAAHTVEG